MADVLCEVNWRLIEVWSICINRILLDEKFSGMSRAAAQPGHSFKRAGTPGIE